MVNRSGQANLGVVAVAVVFLLNPSRGLADDLPTPPAVKNGTSGEIKDITIMGRTFKQGMQVISSSDADSASVEVEIWGPDGGGSRPNLQRHATIKYSFSMWANAQGSEVTETITVKSTAQNLDTGKTTTDRNDSYEVFRSWLKEPNTPYALRIWKATSAWKSDLGHNGSFRKSIDYPGDPKSGDAAIKVTTRYDDVDPVFGPWTYDRDTAWDLKTGRVTSHTVDINGVNPPNPFGCAMVESAVVGRGMATGVDDPSVPPLSGIPMEWPRPPRVI